jgi:hypothetical protein
MSLLRLLTAGKSLVGLRKIENRYHLPGDRTLPRFGSKKNPFRATVFPDKMDQSPTGDSQAHEDPNTSPPAPELQVERQTAPASTSASEAELSGSAGQLGGTPKDPNKPISQSLGLGSSVKALLLWGRARKVRSAGMLANRPMIQGELSLESVKVIRNDLSETDLEIVRVERTSVARTVNHTAVASILEPALRDCSTGMPLGSRASSLFGAVKM